MIIIIILHSGGRCSCVIIIVNACTKLFFKNYENLSIYEYQRTFPVCLCVDTSNNPHPIVVPLMDVVEQKILLSARDFHLFNGFNVFSYSNERARGAFAAMECVWGLS